ncbi:Phosphoribosylamine--glycine ligase [Caldalkalibacillus thermarum TA2.A1]|uniref:Phosphoribosylamine--glycine ligase n=1 Tax=Caldalkalibacillus thermarum (strain TA2.A1) TaxID=986075 RepID=F5L5A4_CALTT|nr:phosphoribosylamine--glycine ligase [Caldalkalibacillus thermarum]EGL83472.1 Phosphoribosylamine--glycine ligase [Caldalkalibacillus thermarum TA2.A1]QZT34620.1 phosphoribosylamine--glycine ligase [Caldalkalibacillus thermarum TA2.A1]
MKVLVIGQGGREHALVWKLKQSSRVCEVYCAPGNGGTAQVAENIPYKETDVQELIHFVKEEGIDYTIVGPENPLLDGIVDAFHRQGLRIFGPTRAAALIEGSKSFAKDLMQKYGIPTGAYATFTDMDEALNYLDQQQAPIVVKADGLAAGKGVVVARTIKEAKQAVKEMMAGKRFGEAGTKVVIEEYLEGEELSLMAFVDGEVVVPMVAAQDHKPVFDGDKGPNTGGMGAYSPVPHIPDHQINQAVETILKPVAKALVEEGRPFQGVLYAGLMITAEGPKVIEFNARLGDPETQVVLPRLKTDLMDIIEAIYHHRLDQLELAWDDSAAVTVVAASEGYPGSYLTGRVITGTEEWLDEQDVMIFHAGTREEGEHLVTSGGRVLSVTALGEDIASARDKAYHVLTTISFDGMHYRKDIGQKALNRLD